jgi:hypothetical protein
MVSSKGIVDVMGWKVPIMQLYSLVLSKVVHQQKQVVEESSDEC